MAVPLCRRTSHGCKLNSFCSQATQQIPAIMMTPICSPMSARSYKRAPAAEHFCGAGGNEGRHFVVPQPVSELGKNAFRHRLRRASKSAGLTQASEQSRPQGHRHLPYGVEMEVDLQQVIYLGRSLGFVSQLHGALIFDCGPMGDPGDELPDEDAEEHLGCFPSDLGRLLDDVTGDYNAPRRQAPWERRQVGSLAFTANSQGANHKGDGHGRGKRAPSQQTVVAPSAARVHFDDDSDDEGWEPYEPIVRDRKSVV